jgi:hypothetical protein
MYQRVGKNWVPQYSRGIEKRTLPAGLSIYRPHPPVNYTVRGRRLEKLHGG